VVAFRGGGEDIAGESPRVTLLGMAAARVHEPALQQLPGAAARISQA
jgi:hypothetical protein